MIFYNLAANREIRNSTVYIFSFVTRLRRKAQLQISVYLIFEENMYIKK